MLLLFRRWCLVLGLLTFSPLPTVGYYEANDVLKCAVNRFVYNLLQTAVQSYQLVQPNVTIILNKLLDTDGRAVLANNTYDFGINGNSLTSAQQAMQPDTAAFPFAAIPVAPVYNLPGMPASFTLALSAPTLAQIYTGNITWWNDTAIQHENPSMTMPTERIIVGLRELVSGTTSYFTHAMSQIDSYFNATIGASPLVSLDQYATNRYAGYIIGDHSSGGDTYYAPVWRTVYTPYSITVTGCDAAIDLNAPLAQMINAAGQRVTCSKEATSIAAMERGVGSDVTQWADCSNAQSLNAWPICGYVYTMVNVASARTTCEAKTSIYSFLDYVINNAAVNSLATTMYILPPAVTSTLSLPPPTCNGTPLLAATVQPMLITGSSYMSNYLNNILSFYRNVDTADLFTFLASDQFQSVSQLINQEISASFINAKLAAQTDPKSWSQFQQSNELQFIPLYVGATTATFRLPDDVLAWHDPTFQYATAYGASEGFGLTIAVLAQIYSGVINKWDSPELLDLNPGLKERYAWAANQMLPVNASITLIVCCSDPEADTTVTQQFFFSLNQAMQRESVNTYFSGGTDCWNTVPFSWNACLTTLKNRTEVFMLANEAQMDQAIALLPGAFGYHISSGVYSNHSEVYYIGSKGSSTVNLAPSLSAQQACLTQSDTLDASNDINNFRLDYTSTGCWPFSYLESVAVMSNYKTGDTIGPLKGNRTLNLLQWMLTEPAISDSARAVGLCPMSTIPQVEALALHALQYITCDGTNCLITLPTMWVLSTGVFSLGLVVGVIGLTACCGAIVFVWVFRQRPMIRSSSVIFQLLTLLGLALLFSCMITVVQNPPTNTSCGAFAWFIDLGVALTFYPLCLKMWRIYRIFSRKQLKVVRIGNMLLLKYLGLLVTVDLVVLSVMQTAAPLIPVTTHVRQGVNDTQYLQCGIGPNSTPPLLILGLTKVLALFCAAILSFSTRKVSSTFNESTTMAWCLYNVILAVAVIIPITVFVNALGDTMIILEIIGIAWISICTLVLLFGTKVYTIMKGESVEAVSILESQRALTGGFSFISIDALTTTTISQYLTALEEHVRAVKRRHVVLTGETREPSVDTKYLDKRSSSSVDNKKLTTSAIAHSHRYLPCYPRSVSRPGSMINTLETAAPNTSRSPAASTHRKTDSIPTQSSPAPPSVRASTT